MLHRRICLIPVIFAKLNALKRHEVSSSFHGSFALSWVRYLRSNPESGAIREI